MSNPTDLETEARELAIEIDRFCDSHDTYEYMDVVDDKLVNIAEIQKDLIDNKTVSLKMYLMEIIEENENDAEAKDLLNMVLAYEAKYHGMARPIEYKQLFPEEYFPISII